MSELGFESIHDAASRSHTVDASLSAEIEALLATSGYTAHSPKPGGASPPRGPVPRFDQPTIRSSAGGLLSRALLAADPLHAEEALPDISGCSNFTRAHDDGTQVLCLKCFPETAQGSRKTEAAAQPPDTGVDRQLRLILIELI